MATFGERFRQLRKEKGLTQDKLGDKFFLNKSSISKYENNGNIPELDTLQKFADYFDVSVDYLLGRTDYRTIFDEFNASVDTNKLRKDIEAIEKSSKKLDANVDLSEAFPIDINTDFINIPIVGVVRAGMPILAVENIEGYIPLPKSIVSNDREYYGLRVKGDSMNLEFKEGAILIVEKTNCIENGEIGVVTINGFEATVKKVIMNNNMITLIPMSNNPEHIPTMYDIEKDEVRVCGKVKHAIKSY